MSTTRAATDDERALARTSSSQRARAGATHDEGLTSSSYRASPYRPSTYAEWTDGALMAAVALQSGEAYTELYRRHSPSVAATTRMILGNVPACDDVVIGVFLGIWVSPGRFDPDRGSLRSYLRLTARGRSIDLVRNETRRRRRELGELHAVRAPTPDADAALLAFEASAEIRHAVSSLPPGEREAIRLAFFAEMSYRSVARYLDVPEGTVKSRIRSGLQRLRRNGALRLDVEGELRVAGERTGQGDAPGDLAQM